MNSPGFHASAHRLVVSMLVVVSACASVAAYAAAAVLVFILSTASAWAAEPADPAKNYMGINVSFIYDENAFVDIMKHGGDWENPTQSGTIPVDSENWPLQDCSNAMFGFDNSLGTYKLFFEGKASTVSMLWGTGSITNLSYNATTNTSTADVTFTVAPSGGLKFLGTQRTAASAINTGIRNVRLCRPGYPTDGSVVFTDEWLTIMRKFHAIRFMDWLYIIWNPIVSWNQRCTPFMASVPPGGTVTVNGRSGQPGCAMEHFIQACNAANADLWINIPVMADDDYITKTAHLILYGSDGRNPYASPQASPAFPPLNPNLKVYAEYGNEIWNTSTIVKPYQWIKAITDSIIAVSNSTHPIVYDGQRDEYYSVARYTAWKSVGMSNLFRAVFGDAAMMTRVRPVLMGQLGGNWFCPQALPFLDGFYATYRPSTDPHPNTTPRPVSYYLYGAGGSGYYGVNDWSSPDPNSFFAGGNYPESGFGPSVANDAIWAGNYGLKRIGYEGGMGLDGGTFTDAQKATLNADPRMKDLTVLYHGIWSASGGDLLVYYEDVHNGHCDWAFTNSVHNPNSPKLQAIDKLRDTLSRTPVSLGGVAPCTVSVSIQSDWHNFVHAGTFYFGTMNGENVLDGIDPGEWVALPVSAQQAGWYRLSARCGGGSSATARLWLNGELVATHQLTGALANTPYYPVQLRRGLNVVRYQPVAGSSCLRSVMLTPSDTVVGVAPRAASAVAPAVRELAVRCASGPMVARVTGLTPGAAYRYALFTMAGRRACCGRVEHNAATLMLPRLHSGGYVLRLVSDGGVSVERISRVF
jgi:hypothetical protein